ncbi:MAG TPA: alpha/beta fold hydrolase [Verrucomicrobiae bacterium]|nr:alpha/beta fold hydrolase [Verrucomicrobiae bacterium]
MTPTPLQIVTADDVAIAARMFHPAAAPRAAVLVVPAMGVSQQYYAAFAAWLADRGFLAATFDYRGMGASRRGSLARLHADILTWARQDCAAMVDALAAAAPGTPLFWVGHSLGGQILPFVPNRERVAKMITVGTGSGYWRENAPPLKRRAWLLWYFIAPLAMRLFGYFPGRRLRMVGDLPRGVMAQWRRWCLDPNYAVGAEPGAREQFAAVLTPIVGLSFADDEYMSIRNIESIHGFYAHAPRRMKRLTPADVGARRIGHFGFFRPGNAERLWAPHLLPELA